MFQDSYRSKWAQSRQARCPIVHNITTLKPCYNHITPFGISDSMVLRICDHICVQSHPVQTIRKDAAIQRLQSGPLVLEPNIDLFHLLSFWVDCTILVSGVYPIFLKVYAVHA
jgi:hypothetical protein